MRLLLPILTILSACASSQSDSMDNAVDEVLKHQEGVTIEITPQKK
jgi:hypothetical protein